ncbi:MAG: hypothetical protein IPK83_11745 [Planctomycetes bacterium]|nr:hypothetical protein [Planctomycetota bacterium]
MKRLLAALLIVGGLAVTGYAVVPSNHSNMTADCCCGANCAAVCGDVCNCRDCGSKCDDCPNCCDKGCSCCCADRMKSADANSDTIASDAKGKSCCVKKAS